MGTAHPVFVPYQNFRGSDGAEFFLSCFTDGFWRSLCDVVDRPQWIDDPRFRDNPSRCENRGDLIPEMEAIFAGRPAAHWVKVLGERNVPAALVQDLNQALREDPQVKHLEMIVEQDHPRAGRIETLRTPVRFADTPPAIRRPPPVFGQHTEGVLREFGIGVEEIEKLLADGIVAGAPQP